jgi:hypothetical protein
MNFPFFPASLTQCLQRTTAAPGCDQHVSPTASLSLDRDNYHHTLMKTSLLLAACLMLVGCGRQEQSNREVLDKLEALKSELASKRSEPVHWAFANKREIDSAISTWTYEKMEAIKKSEALPPETEQKIRQLEAWQTQLTHKQMEGRGFRMSPRIGATEFPLPDESVEALSERVAAARAPLTDILERRNRQAAEYREQFSTERLIAEYVKDRFDLVVDSSDGHTSRSTVLYRKDGEVVDITDAILKLFREKAKP